MEMRDKERTPYGQRLFDARKATGLTQPKVAVILGISQSNLSDLERGAMGSSFTAELATLYRCDPLWLATGEGSPHPNRGETQNLTDARNIPSRPKLSWAELMHTELPPEFRLQVRDDAMAPEIRPRDWVSLSTSRKPRAGRPVLFKDRDGNIYLRNYLERRPGHWIAEATNKAYAPLDSLQDELQVLAVMIGIEWADEEPS